MNFDLTNEQRLLRDSAERFIASDYPLESRASRLRQLPLNREVWRIFAEMGWLLSGVPEDNGGFGGPTEVALVAQQFGRGLIAEPFLGSAVLATSLVAACPSGELTARLIEAAGNGERILAAAVSESGARGRVEHCACKVTDLAGQPAISGRKTLVLGAPDADVFIVSARRHGSVTSKLGIGIYAVEAADNGVSITSTPLVDGSSAGIVQFDNALGTLLSGDAEGATCLKIMQELSISAIVAESLGIIERLNELTAEYLATRQQFGGPLSQFQVLRHRMADMVVAAQFAEATLHLVLAAFESENQDCRAQTFAGAKGWIGDALRRVSGWALQSHGGMGLAEELPIGRFFQRMMVLDSIMGSGRDNWRRCAEIAQSSYRTSAHADKI